MKSLSGPTDKQIILLKFLKAYYKAHHKMPTIAEVSDYMGVVLSSGALMLKRLENKNLLRKTIPGSSRNTALTPLALAFLVSSTMSEAHYDT